MANTLQLGYIATMVSRQTLLVLLRENLMARMVFREFERDIAREGDTVTTRRPSKFTPKQKVRGVNYVRTDLAPTQVQVKLDQHWYNAFVIDDIDDALTTGGFQKVMEDHIVPSGQSLSQKIDDSLLGLHTDITAFTGTDGVAPTPETLVDARKLLNDKSVPKSPRFGILSTAASANLLKPTPSGIFVKVNESGSTRGLMEAEIGRKYGIGWFESEGVATTDLSSVIRNHNLVFHRNAFALVTRVLPSVPAGLGAVTMVEEREGIGIRTVITYDGNLGGVQVVQEVLYGVKTLDADMAVQIRS